MTHGDEEQLAATEGPARHTPSRPGHELSNRWWRAGITAAFIGLGGCAVTGCSGKKAAARESGDAAEKPAVAVKAKPAMSKPGDEWSGAIPIRVAEAFAQATTHEMRMKLVREPERVGAMMKAFFQSGPGVAGEIAGIDEMGAASTVDFAFQRFQVRLKDGGSRLMCVVFTVDGPKVDFECYARHGSATWDELLGGKVAEADEVRVFVEQGFTYVYDFGDDEKWSCYLATTPDFDGTLNFYAPRGSDLDTKLKKQTAGGPMRATLAIRPLGDSYKHRQFEVTAVHAAGWIR